MMALRYHCIHFMTSRTTGRNFLTQPTSIARPRILQLALPTILGNILFSTVALIQTKFVGGLGPEAVAAVGVGQRVFFALQAILAAIGVGTAALVARSWGAGDRTEAARVTMASVVLAAGASCIVMLIGTVFSHQIAGWFGLDSVTTRLAADNIFWFSIFIAGFAVDIILCGALRATGNAWTPLIFVAMVNAINVPLLYAFILGHWGAPAMGAPGAAFATGLSLSGCAVVLVTLWVRQHLTIGFVGGLRSHTSHFKQLFKLSAPAALEQAVLQIGFFAFLILIGTFYGTEAFAAYNVGLNMLNIAMVVGMGFSIAGSTLVGQNLGAGDIAAAKRSGWRACMLAMASMGTLGVIISINAATLARYFLGNEEVTVQRAIELTHILAAMLPLLGIDMAIGGSLRGAGDTRFPLFSTFAGLIGMRCGLAALFAWMELPVLWVYGSMIGDYILKSSLLIWRFRSGRWIHAIKATAAR
jgi:putative MATE family efflux protein